MPCYSPLLATYGDVNPATGKRYVKILQGFKNCNDTGLALLNYDIANENRFCVPCGQCIGCRLERSRQWAVRCCHEASLYKENCFITLTFNDYSLRENGSLNKKDFTKFMKRFRKKFGEGIRFFECGEYGSKLGRPHHHACIFNFDFPDRQLWQIRDGVRLYRSEQLEKLWSKRIKPEEVENYPTDLVWYDMKNRPNVKMGFCTVGDVTFESAAYVARYLMKKIVGKNSEDHYGEKIPEYINMSRKPGIARDWIKEYETDVYPHDYVVIRNDIKCKPPKYYDYIYELTNSSEMDNIKFKRKLRLLDKDFIDDRRRLPVKEKCCQLKVSKLKRSLDEC